MSNYITKMFPKTLKAMVISVVIRKNILLHSINWMFFVIWKLLETMDVEMKRDSKYEHITWWHVLSTLPLILNCNSYSRIVISRISCWSVSVLSYFFSHRSPSLDVLSQTISFFSGKLITMGIVGYRLCILSSLDIFVFKTQNTCIASIGICIFTKCHSNPRVAGWVWRFDETKIR